MFSRAFKTGIQAASRTVQSSSTMLAQTAMRNHSKFYRYGSEAVGNHHTIVYYKKRPSLFRLFFWTGIFVYAWNHWLSGKQRGECHDCKEDDKIAAADAKDASAKEFKQKLCRMKEKIRAVANETWAEDQTVKVQESTSGEAPVVVDLQDQLSDMSQRVSAARLKLQELKSTQERASQERERMLQECISARQQATAALKQADGYISIDASDDNENDGVLAPERLQEFATLHARAKLLNAKADKLERQYSSRDKELSENEHQVKKASNEYQKLVRQLADVQTRFKQAVKDEKYP